MSRLSALPLRHAYHKPEDDIAREFYLPCMAAACTYERAVGFFSSAIYAVAWSSLKAFVRNGGRMRLICSPILAEADVAAMQEGYSARLEVEEAAQIRGQFEQMLRSPQLAKPARALAALVALGIIDIRIAWVGHTTGGQPRRLFHDKVGIFRDVDGNSVVFKGSMNETWPGLALDGNLESVDVFVSWAGGRDLERVRAEQQYFDRLWADQFPGVRTVALPEVACADLIAAGKDEDWEALTDEICAELSEAGSVGADLGPGGRRKRRHQQEALKAWLERGRRGIFEHATGSGKTFTALCAIQEALESGEVPLVLVPSDLLLQQWAAELRACFPELQLLVCGGGATAWRDDGRLRTWTRPHMAGARPRAVLSTLQTAASPEFLALCRGGPHLFLVADEVHRLGSPQHRQVLQLDSGPRLGLSATPRRAGDPEGTNTLFSYFEGTVPPPFTLQDAIQAGALTRYAYHVLRVSLEAEEQAQWDAVTLQIRRLNAQTRSGGRQEQAQAVEGRLKHLLIRRARIVKSAIGKVAAAAAVVREHYRPGHRWIVYCDDRVQLDAVKARLVQDGCPDVLEYHTAMEEDARATLELFEARGGVVVSIRCLDEGVDIPAVSHALILASSKNPREYIQRRGRVLRRHPTKVLSHIFDVLVTPRLDLESPPGLSILEGEILRAIEFGKQAINPGCITDLQRLAAEYGLEWSKFGEDGIESDDPASEEDAHA